MSSSHASSSHASRTTAGVYADHFIWRFENLLGRTMREFSGVADEPRLLVIARLDRDHNAGRGSRLVPEESLPPELRERLIVYGALSTLNGGEPAGVALAIQVPDRDAVVALLEDERTGVDVFQAVDIHARSGARPAGADWGVPGR